MELLLNDYEVVHENAKVQWHGTNKKMHQHFVKYWHTWIFKNIYATDHCLSTGHTLLIISGDIMLRLTYVGLKYKKNKDYVSGNCKYRST